MAQGQVNGTYNRIEIVGHLGADPEIRTVGANGTTLTKFSVATDRLIGPKDEHGRRNTTTDWHRIECWGRLAEVCGEYLRRGAKAHVIGSVKVETYDKSDGSKGTAVVVVASDVIFDRPGRGEGQSVDEAVEADYVGDEESPL